MDVKYILDSNVDNELDLKLRTLLSTCFVGAHNARFKTQRYYNQLPQHRWYILGDQDEVVAHIALHERTVNVNDKVIAIGGVSEVCVLPAYRGQGLVHLLLKHLHEKQKALGMAFSVLFGETEVYGSTGYQKVENLHLMAESGEWGIGDKVMVLAVNAKEKWPSGEVYLDGAYF
ncbi:GNAT family N-acetyltransferase [Thaumasiovibrio subtropicus]|uniref:GNAT family N-acetyltransferase n=1 Tax=Thaumasiovibrio subtropicus TaxID=1891207 RepID=UPI000B35FCC3|nr:GNAT family N-acetyltransferase [Thaumasiovibrio subtropicus]